MKALAIAAFLSFPTLATAQQGVWELPVFNFGDSSHPAIYPVHLIHVYDGTTGKILALTQEVPPDPSCFAPRSRLWTPDIAPGNPGSYESVRFCRTDVFCGGHSALANGRILTAGGNYSVDATSHPTTHANLFDPVRSVFPLGNQWNENNSVFQPDMTYPRFYPTCTTLSDGRVLVSSGTINSGVITPVTAEIPEIYEPSPTAPYPNVWTPLINAQKVQGEYPWMFVLPDGNLLYAGPGDSYAFPVPPNQSQILLTSNNSANPLLWTWGANVLDPTWPSPVPIPPGDHGSAVMYEPGKVMKCDEKHPLFSSPDEYAALGTTFVADLDPASPGYSLKWKVAASMNRPRLNHNLVILPDGKVLAVGGGTRAEFAPAPPLGQPGNSPVLEAELFDPVAGTWTPQPASDFFNPPYITSAAPRTTITSAPPAMQYNQAYNIHYSLGGGNKATKACLIRLGAVTHGFDQDQRRVPLTITASSELPPSLEQTRSKPHSTGTSPLPATTCCLSSVSTK